MSDGDEALGWLYEADTLAEFVEIAEEHGSASESQLRALLEHVWGEDVPVDRARRVLRRERQRLDDRETDRPSVPERAPRYTDLGDLELLSAYEFEHVLAAVLGRVEGEASVTGVGGPRDVDVVWERDGRTTGLVVVVRDVDDLVGTGPVEAVHAGATTTDSDHAIDVSAVVTTSRYTEDARSAAEEADVRLYGRPHLERWLAEAELDAAAMGETLEGI